MAKVKIFLEPNETLQEAEGQLQKAFDLHNSGDVHASHQFQDPAMVSVAQKMEQKHKQIHQEMMQEIFEELDKDYLK